MAEIVTLSVRASGLTSLPLPDLTPGRRPVAPPLTSDNLVLRTWISAQGTTASRLDGGTLTFG
jgi:hypothetical protein